MSHSKLGPKSISKRSPQIRLPNCIRTRPRTVTGQPPKVASSNHVPQNLPKLWGHLHVIGGEGERMINEGQKKRKQRKRCPIGRVWSRPVAPKPSPYMGWVWGLPDSPDLWGVFGDHGWVHVFTSNLVRAVRPDVWGRFRNSAWRCSKNFLFVLVLAWFLTPLGDALKPSSFSSF